MNRVSQCINQAIFIFAQKSQSSSRTIKLSRDEIISRRKLNQHLTLFERNIMNFIENFEQGCISFYMCIIYFFIFFSIVHKCIMFQTHHVDQKQNIEKKNKCDLFLSFHHSLYRLL